MNGTETDDGFLVEKIEDLMKKESDDLLRSKFYDESIPLHERISLYLWARERRQEFREKMFFERTKNVYVFFAKAAIFLSLLETAFIAGLSVGFARDAFFDRLESGSTQSAIIDEQGFTVSTKGRSANDRENFGFSVNSLGAETDGFIAVDPFKERKANATSAISNFSEKCKIFFVEHPDNSFRDSEIVDLFEKTTEYGQKMRTRTLS